MSGALKEIYKMKLLNFISRLAHSSNKNKNKDFDLSTLTGIQSISLSAVSESSSFSCNQIEYQLQRKASEYKCDGNMDLAIECLRKANELMLHSHTEYPKKDYYRLIEYLEFAGRIDEAHLERAKLDEYFDANGLRRSVNEIFQKKTTPLPSGPDLVEVGYIACCCSECAKYRERIYSYYGKDSRFPIFPRFLLDHPDHCGLIAMPFEFDYCSFRTIKGKDLRGKALIKFSNRPFIDDRTPEEKVTYENLKNDQIDRTSYAWLQKFAPDICPKSYGGYRRMKNANSTNFQKLQTAAKEKNFDVLTGEYFLTNK